MEEPSGGDSSGVSPSNLQLGFKQSLAAVARLSVLVFLISPPPPFATRRGTLFIVSFRSRRSHMDEDRRCRSHEMVTSMSHAAKASGHMGLAHLLLGPPLLHFICS
jgi:hypothetical protein